MVVRLLVGVAVLACLASCTAQAAPTTAAAPPPPPPTSIVNTTTTPPPPPPPPPPCSREVRACVSLSAKQAWLLRGGRLLYGPVPIAHGGRANPTPTGTYPVSWKDADNTSSLYGDPMPYSVFFAPGGIAFHQGDIRTNSHGCVRLPMPAARRFFWSLQPGELVQVVP
jgi:L,D-transpeptidase catalytic domain